MFTDCLGTGRLGRWSSVRKITDPEKFLWLLGLNLSGKPHEQESDNKSPHQFWILDGSTSLATGFGFLIAHQEGRKSDRKHSAHVFLLQF
jgi:hypothetical protein